MQELSRGAPVKKQLIYRTFPIAAWVFGTVIIIVALYLLYHLAPGQQRVLFDSFREGHWWQFLFAVLLLALGLTLLFTGKIDSLIISKDDGTIKKVKTTVTCTREVVDW